MYQSLGQTHPLTVAFRKGTYLLLLLGLKSGYLYNVVNLILYWAIRFVKRGGKLKVFPYIHLGIERIVFGKIADPLLYLKRTAGSIYPVHKHLS